MEHSLLLASGSFARRQLLQEARIPFSVIHQSADESACDWGMSLPQVVRSIAVHKMSHALLPRGSKEGEKCFVLTADTLCLDNQGRLQGKPEDCADAVAKIKASRGGVRAGTAFCLDRKIWHSESWHLEQRIERYVDAYFEFDVPDHCIDQYIAQTRCLETAGAIVIEGYGFQFLKRVDGSFTTILGLPLFEVREALHEIGFW